MEPPPFRFADRYDLIALVLALAVVAVLIALGVSVWLVIAAGGATVSGAAFLLRRRAGVPQATVLQRLRRGRAGR